MTGIENSTPKEQKPADWATELSPEDARLKEMVSLMSVVMQTVRLVDRPHQKIADYAEGLLRQYAGEMPQSAIDELQKGREALLDEAATLR